MESVLNCFILNSVSFFFFFFPELLVVLLLLLLRFSSLTPAAAPPFPEKDDDNDNDEVTAAGFSERVSPVRGRFFVPSPLPVPPLVGVVLVFAFRLFAQFELVANGAPVICRIPDCQKLGYI